MTINNTVVRKIIITIKLVLIYILETYERKPKYLYIL